MKNDDFLWDCKDLAQEMIHNFFELIYLEMTKQELKGNAYFIIFSQNC